MQQSRRAGLRGILMLCIVLLFLAASTRMASAATTYTKISSSTVLSTSYGFAPRFITGQTTLETFGATSTWADDCWTTDSTSWHDQWMPLRLTSSTQKGKVGGIYRNVGTYKGKTVDMKLTIVDWKELHKPYAINGRMSYPTIAFSGHSLYIGMSGYMIKSPKFKVEFLQDGKAVPVSGHLNFKDIDAKQMLESDDFTRGYLTNTTKLSVSSGRLWDATGVNVEESDTDYWCTYVSDELTSFSFIFSNTNVEAYDFSQNRNYRGIHSMGFGGDSIAPFDTPVPIKAVDKQVMNTADTLTYTVDLTVPKQPEAYYYSKFLLSDTLPDPLSYTGFTVKDDMGKDVTAGFKAAQKGQIIEIVPTDLTAAGFYYKSYLVQIRTKLKSGYDLKTFSAGGKTLLQNQVSLTAKPGSMAESKKTSNAVSTEVKFKIDTETDGHGTITSALTGISGGTDKTITYTPKAGYELNKVLVDGKSVSIETYKSSYTFSSIYADHEIRAAFVPTTDNKVTITKRIAKGDVYAPYGTPVAIFKLNGTDLNGVSHTYYQEVVLDETTLNGSYYSASVNFDNLTAGNYTCSEIDVSRYSFAGISSVTGGSISAETIKFDLVNNKAGKGTYTNTLNNYSLTSHSDVVVNQFK